MFKPSLSSGKSVANGLRQLDPRRSFRARLGLSLGAISLLFSLLIGLLFAFMTVNREQYLAGNTLAMQAFHASEKIDRVMVERYRDIDLASTNALLQAGAPHAPQRAFLEKMRDTYRYYTWIGLLDTGGKVVASTDGLLEGLDFSREPLFTEAQTHVFIGEAEEDEAPEDVVSDLVEGEANYTMVSAPVFDANGNLTGVLGAYVDWEWTQEIVRSVIDSVQNGDRIEVFVLDRHNHVLIGPPNLLGSALTTSSVGLARQGVYHYAMETWPDGHQYITGFSLSHVREDFSGLERAVLVRQEAVTALAAGHKFVEINAWLSLAMGIGWIWAGWFLAGRVAGPMISIAHALNRIRHGEASVTIPAVRGQDEVALLSTSLDEMVQNTNRQEQELKALNEELLSELAERTRAEEALRASEEKYRALVAHSSEGIMRYEVDTPIPTSLPLDDQLNLLFEHGYLAECNDVMARMYGLASRDELIGARIGDLLPPGDPDNIEYLRAFIVSGYRITEAESRERDVNGNEKCFSNNLVGVVEDGMLLRAWGSQRDITERKKMETALQESEVKFRSVAASATDGIISTDGVGAIIYLNKSAEVLFGYTAEEMLGQPLSLLVPERYKEMQNRGLRMAASESGKQVQRRPIELWGLRRDGTEFPMELSIASWETGQGKFYTGIVRDITERKRAEESRLAKEAAEEASRAKSEFLSRMSHELRTPLNSILGFGELLQMDGPNKSQEESIGYIMRAGKHLLGLINEILDISRIEAGRISLSLEPVEIAWAIDECLDLVRPLADERKLLIEVIDPSDNARSISVIGDQQRLKQVLLNLLANAIKYNVEGGIITLEYREHIEAGVKLLRISVTDMGPGIAAEKLSKLFSPFERLDAERYGVEGTGLGLVLTKRLMEAMGGTVGVESVVGQGSTFWIELPVKEAEPDNFEQAITGPLSDLQLPGEPRTILYLADNLANFKLVEQVVERIPEIKLLAAMRGSDGIDLAQACHPDLILLDMRLPDMPGREVLQRLKDHIETASIPVVVISADGTEAQAERLLVSGARSYLTRPFEIRALLEALQTTSLEKAQV